MTRLENLAYAAGLIDGEGCIGIYRNSHNGNYQLRIAVQMCDASGLTILESLFGGRFYHRKAVPPRRARTIWIVFNSAAESALKELMPFLRVKKMQAETALIANWSWQKKSDGKFFKLIPKEEQSLRIACHAKMKILNERGYYVD